MQTLVRAAVVAALLVGLAAAQALAGETINARLSGYDEVPAVSTTGSGEFRARVSPDGAGIEYELTYSGIEGDVSQSHLHVGRRSTNGGISVWICGNPELLTVTPPAGTQRCPESGSVSGTITASNVVGPAPQLVTAGEFEELLAAIRVGAVYVNVHSTSVPGGEIRGQLRGSSRPK